MRKGAGRPAKYLLASGARVPGVTTITGRFKDSGGLVQWAYTCGLDGIDINKARDNAGSAGSLGHALIEADIHQREPELLTARELGMTAEEYTVALDRAYTSLDAFRDWRAAVSLDVLVTELPLISEVHRFGGTLDAVAMIGGKRALMDWKTSGKVYPDYLVQVAAYRGLWEESRPEEPIEALHLLRLDKVFGSFHHHSWPIAVLDTAWNAFVHMRALYDIDQILKKAAA